MEGFRPVLIMIGLGVGLRRRQRPAVAVPRSAQAVAREDRRPTSAACRAVGDARERQSVKFYLVAMIFLLFDIEVAFLYPWAIAFRDLGVDRVLADRHVLRAAADRLHLRLAQGRVRLERASGRAGAGDDEHEPAEWLTLEIPDPDHHRREDGAVGAPIGDLAGDVRPGLLRDRDDGDELRPLRHRALRRRGVPRLAAPVRPDDRRRPAVAEDGAGAAPHLRPDARAQVGHLDGRLRQLRRRVRQLRHRPGRATRSCRSTSSCRAARRGPRRSSTASCSFSARSTSSG